MDILHDIVDTLALKGAFYFRTDFSPPWSVKVPDLAGAARFHLVLQGRCNVEVDGGGAVDLGPGDLLLIPRGRAHALSDAPGRSPRPLETVLDAVGYDGRGAFVLGEADPSASTQMVCGHYAFRQGADHPILRALPDYLLTNAAGRAKNVLLDEMLRLVAQKVFSDDLGAPATLTRLSEIIFIELLRVSVDHAPALGSVIEALNDPQIGKAISLIHAEPAQRWTVDSLARAVGMSRSRFAERFRALVGEGPMRYLADWRLQRALALLDRPQASIQRVAIETGYRSPAAFARAFSEKFGLAPSDYRRQAA